MRGKNEKKGTDLFFKSMKETSDARKARVVVPNTPHHIVQRGHNRQVVFVERRDYHYYLQNLREWKEKLACKLYAYCLMTGKRGQINF